MKAERPDTLVTVAGEARAAGGVRRPPAGLGHLAARGIVDVVSARWPTRLKPRGFGEQISSAPCRCDGDRPFWAGIGAYRLSAAQTVENIQTARKLGAAGVILFSYDSLSDPHVVSRTTSRRSHRAAFAPHTASPGSR